MSRFSSRSSHYRLEDDEFEDDLIVYGEPASSSSSHRLDHRSSRHYSQQQQQQQTLPPTQCSQQTDKSGGLAAAAAAAAAANGFISRDERRKRRREWKERVLLEEREHETASPFPEEEEEENVDHSDGDSDSDSEKSNDSDGNDRGGGNTDTFASLQALLQESSPPSPSQSQPQERKEAPSSSSSIADALSHVRTPQTGIAAMEVVHEPTEEESSNENKIPVMHRQDTEPVSNVSSREQNSTETLLQVREEHSFEPSPPDFPTNVNDSEDEDDAKAIIQEMNERKRRSSLNRGNTTTTTRKKQKEKERRIRDKAKRARSSPPPTPQFETPQSPPPPPNHRKRRRHSIHGSKPEATRILPRPPVVTQVTQDSKTIVGMRPTHWQRTSATNGMRGRSSKALLAQSQPMSRMKILKAATLQSMHSTSTSQPSSSRFKAGTAPRSKDLAAILRKEKNLANIKPNSETITAERLRKMTFHPQTMPKPRAAPEVLTSQIEQDDDNRNAATNNSSSVVAIDRPSFSSPTTSRRHRASKSHGNSSKSGPWTKRLAALKSNQTNDAMKLQHPGMNRHGVSFDLNDPRKKAKSYTDVTVLSDHDESSQQGVKPKSWSLSTNATGASSGDGSLLTVLGHIHRHAPIINHRCTESLPTSTGDTTLSEQGSFAWISFTRTTARNVGLRKGMALRLYDAVLLPVHRMVGPEQGESRDDRGTMECRFLVICTQLCEEHPGKLDPVPNFDVAAFRQATSKD